MQTARITSNMTVGGIAFGSTVVRTAEGQISQVVSLPAGVAGAVSATGVDGLASGHGIAQGALVDVHWTADGVAKCRRGLTVDTAATNAITFDNDPAAEGDALPAEDTAVVVSAQVPIVVDFDGDDCEMIAAAANRAAVIDFRSAAESLLAVNLSANEAWSWYSGQQGDNPLTGDPVASIVASNATTTAAVLQVGILYQSVS
jgi:hypothetical protein